MLIINQNLEYFFFCKYLDDKIKKNILKFNKINLIYSNKNIKTLFNDLDKFSTFCKSKQIRFFIIDNYKLAVKYKANGLFLSSSNKNKSYNNLPCNQFKIIGSAHNQIEYFHKFRQKCEMITLSPVFFTKKYSCNKVIGINKFNLTVKNWRTKSIALGGIKKKNLNKLRMIKCNGFGFISLIEEI